MVNYTGKYLVVCDLNSCGFLFMVPPGVSTDLILRIDLLHTFSYTSIAAAIVYLNTK